MTATPARGTRFTVDTDGTAWTIPSWTVTSVRHGRVYGTPTPAYDRGLRKAMDSWDLAEWVSAYGAVAATPPVPAVAAAEAPRDELTVAVDHPGAAGLTEEDIAEEVAQLAEATGMTVEEARDVFLEGREEVLADDAVCEQAGDEECAMCRYTSGHTSWCPNRPAASVGDGSPAAPGARIVSPDLTRTEQVRVDADAELGTLTSEPGGFGAAIAGLGFGEGRRGDSWSAGPYWTFDHPASLRVVVYTDDGDRVELIGFDPTRPAAMLLSWKVSFDGTTPQSIVLAAIANALGVLPVTR